MSVRSTHLAAVLCLGLLATACSSSGTKRSLSDMSQDERNTAFAAYGTPNEHHKKFDALIGKFKYTSQCRMTPTDPFHEMTGNAEYKWSMGNRFIESSADGSFMGMPFEGHGYWGYDNSTNEYVGFWMDNMGTGLMPISHGSVDKTGTVFTFERDYNCPITGQPTHTREVLTIKSKNEHTLEMYNEIDGGDEYKAMSIQFKRN